MATNSKDYEAKYREKHRERLTLYKHEWYINNRDRLKKLRKSKQSTKRRIKAVSRKVRRMSQKTSRAARDRASIKREKIPFPLEYNPVMPETSSPRPQHQHSGENGGLPEKVSGEDS